MKTPRFYLCFAVFAFAAATTAAPAQVHISPGGGNVVAILAHDARVHAEAMRSGLRSTPIPTVKVGNAVTPVINHNGTMKALRAKVRGATLACIDYRSNATGASISVHARSGRSVLGTITQLSSRRNGASSSGSEAGADISDQELAQDAREASWYPPDNGDVRARNLQRRQTWVVEPIADSDGTITHGGDAELKALRQLELEFERDPTLASEGGEITGYVSKRVCASCRSAFEAFSSRYNVKVNVFDLPDTNIPAQATLADTVVDNIDDASAASARVLSDVRTKLIDEILPTNAEATADAGRWSGMYDHARLAAAEAGSLTANEACQTE